MIITIIINLNTVGVMRISDWIVSLKSDRLMFTGCVWWCRWGGRCNWYCPLPSATVTLFLAETVHNLWFSGNKKTQIIFYMRMTQNQNCSHLMVLCIHTAKDRYNYNINIVFCIFDIVMLMTPHIRLSVNLNVLCIVLGNNHIFTLSSLINYYKR